MGLALSTAIGYGPIRQQPSLQTPTAAQPRKAARPDANGPRGNVAHPAALRYQAANRRDDRQVPWMADSWRAWPTLASET